MTTHATPLAATRVRSRIAAVTTALAVIGALLPATAAAAAEAPLPAPDGLTQATAAASCWEVKQQNPASADGVYWLNTPELGAPEQFYCDQTTDGGGWVLIGRGREDWSQSNEGQGTAQDVRANVTGSAAFAPRQLSSEKIDALLNGTDVSSLADGVRLRRATAVNGSSFQEVRFTYATPRADWSWLFKSEQRIGTWRIGTSSGSGGTLKNFGTGTGLQRVTYDTSASNGWSNGFGYGTSVAGSTSGDSYIYKGSTGYARPFTQVYLRPQLRSADIFSAIPDTGTAEVTKRSIASSFALPTVWGVNGLGAAGSGIQNTEVSAFTEANGVVYVGGNFAAVQRNSSGGSRVAQPYLAAFDVRSGELITSFRPTFNHQVKALATLPDGRIAVGGNFSSVNGQPIRGLVVLNADGSVSSTFTGRLINKLTSSGGQPIVRSLDVQGNWLYAAGNFTHATGGSSSAETYSRGAVRLAVGNGAPDNSWRTEFDGTVISIDASERGDKVYFAGYFGTNKGERTVRAAALTATDASVIPWTVDLSSDERSGYQQAVKEVGGRVWLGGSEHMLFSYDRDSMQEVSTNITIQGGDFQAISADGDNVYAGCHCTLANYEGARKWPSLGPWFRASKIDQTGTWSASTGAYQAEFSPFFSMREGAGTWALFTDSTGVTWMGGDFTGARRTSTVAQWAGGFARFPRIDSTAPSSPSRLAVQNTDTGVALSWGGSTDASGSVTYQVLRNDRVVATTSGTSLTLPAAPAGTRYFVRAADPTGNISASTAAVEAGGTTIPTDPEPIDPSVVVPAGAVWSYYYGVNAPSSDWKTQSGGDWATGNAPFGWGHAGIVTRLDAPDPKPLTSYYRKTVQVEHYDALKTVTLTTRADDGIVVYVNGAEVGRSNMGSGTIGHGSYATSAINATNAVANPVTFTVPSSAFVAGENVISAEVHSNYRATPSASFELSAVAEYGSPGDPGTPGEQPEEPVDPDQPADPNLVTAGSLWSYHYAADAPVAGWASASATDWQVGPAPFGWGHASIATPLDAAAPKPLTSYYRKSIEVASPSAFESVTLTTRADDGIVVYLNGVEVGRSNMPAGPVNHGSYAISAINATNALANPVTFTVPASALRAGTNLIAAEVHSNYRATPSASFELTAVATLAASQEPTGPSEPEQPEQPQEPEQPEQPGAGLPSGTAVIAEGSTWSYSHETAAPAAQWRDVDFDASAWKNGPAPLGWGTGPIATQLVSPGPQRPLASYFRSGFTIPEGQVPTQGLTLTTRADDGIVVYVNGVEVGRTNLAPGPITHDSTWALTAPNTAFAIANPVTYTVPASVLRSGANVVTVQMQSNYRATPSGSFELSAVVN